MPPVQVRAQEVRAVPPPPVATDPEVLAQVREDASHFAGGRAAGLVRPRSEEEVAAALARAAAEHVPVLVIGAQSSLTGGAVPLGDRVIATAGLDSIGRVNAGVATGSGASLAASATVWVGPGARLDRLRESLLAQGWDYPPVPTYQQACLGGTVATNAAGSATYKYGTTRAWVRSLRVLTVEGYLLELERGAHVAPAGGEFELALPDGGIRRFLAPSYPSPAVKKSSMGYYSAPELDLVDLFIGSEGTLGVITGVKIALMRPPPAMLAAMVFTKDEPAAVELATALRQASEYKRTGRAGSLVDVRAIEHLDGASLNLVRARGLADRLKMPLPRDARVALYLEIELPEPVSDSAVLDDLGRVTMGSWVDTPVGQLFLLLAKRRLLENVELALPGEPSRLAAFREFREAVPLAVNETVAERRRLDPAIAKLAGDMCVPFEKLGELLTFQRKELSARGLEHVVFGHISDGNVHPNVLARSAEEMARGREALLAIAVRVKELGGSPLSEHGVGRNPLKQEMMARHHGEEGLAQMKAVKSALDPHWRLARGVLFSR